MEDLTGKQLGPYQVVAPLGEGGMAAVYKAYQPAVDRNVALKILPRHFASDPQFVGRFHQEARVIAKLQHPHILPVFDFGEADSYTYIVMPFLESGTLTNLLHGRPLPLSQIVSIVSQLGDALDYAHSRGIVHRDVKPSNVLIDERGNCLLTDFGIAKIVEGTAKFTSTGGIIGTPVYMSPEQGLGHKLDGRSDIYALGVILHEMATGIVPYDAETPMAIVIKHINDPLRPPRTINPALPEAIERVILKALAKDPADRYQTARAMVEALQKIGADTDSTQILPGPAGPPTVVSRPAGQPQPAAPARARPAGLVGWAGIAAALAVLAACLGALVLAGSRVIGQLPALNAGTPTAGQALALATTPPVLPSRAPAATTTAAAPVAPAATTSTAVAVPATEAEDSSAASDTLYVTGWGGQGVYAVDLSEGRIAGQTTTSLYNNRYLAWNAAREELYVAADNGGLVSVVQRDPLSEIATISHDLGWNAYSIAVSPTGDAIYLATANGGEGLDNFRQITALDPATRRSSGTVRLDDRWGPAFLALSPDGQRLYVSWDANLDTYSTADLSLIRNDSDLAPESSRLLVSADGRQLFIVRAGQLIAWAVDDSAMTTLPLPGVASYSWIAIANDGQRLWVASEQNRLYEVPATFDDPRTIELPDSAISIVPARDDSHLYVLHSKGTLSVIDLSTYEVVQTISGLTDGTDVIAIAP